MCKYSLEAYKTRKAVRGETLVVGQHSGRNHGVLTKPGTEFTGTLTCVRDGQKLTIENVEFQPGATETVFINYGLNPDALNLTGKRAVFELVDGTNHRIGMDLLRISHNLQFPLAWIKPGTEVHVGVKRVKKEVTLDEKLGLDMKSLRRAAVDMGANDPNPRPDEEDTEEKKEKEDEAPREAARLEYHTPFPASRPRLRTRVLVYRDRD
jgi:hypothetical protein